MFNHLSLFFFFFLCVCDCWEHLPASKAETCDSSLKLLFSGYRVVLETCLSFCACSISFPPGRSESCTDCHRIHLYTLQMLSLTSHLNIHFYWNHYLCILLPWNPLLPLFTVLASCLYLQYHSQLSLLYHFSFLKFSCSSDSTIFKTPFACSSCVCSLSAAVYARQWILRTDLFISFETLKSPSVVTLLLPTRQQGAAIHRKLSEVHEGV